VAFMPFSYSRSIALGWRFGREAGYGVNLLYVVKMPHENVQLLASLLQRLFNIRVYNRHRSIHHAISFAQREAARDALSDPTSASPEM